MGWLARRGVVRSLSDKREVTGKSEMEVPGSSQQLPEHYVQVGMRELAS